MQLPSGVLVINPGSVGCPAYDDPGGSPPHVSESGSPHARYAIISLSSGLPSVDLLAIAYAHEEAAACALLNERPDWAHALATGCIPTR